MEGRYRPEFGSSSGRSLSRAPITKRDVKGDKKGKVRNCEMLRIEFGQRSSIHGVRAWLDPRKGRMYRITFFLIWIGFFGYCSRLIYENVKRYLEYNIQVSETDEKVDELIFPSVTICPTHSWKKSRVGGDLIGMRMALGRPDLGNACYDKNIPNLNFSDYSFWDYGKLLRDGFDSLWIPFNKTFVSCEFMEKTYDCGELFFGHITSLGRCYTFNYRGIFNSTQFSLLWVYADNVRKNLKVRSSGWRNSLRILLDFQRKEYCVGYPDEKMGFRVSLHDPNSLPPFLDNSFLLSPGWSTEAVITATRTIKEKVEDLGRCKTKASLPLFHGINYTQENCLVHCLAEEAFKQCRCLLRYCPVETDRMTEVLRKLHPGVKEFERYDKFLPCHVNLPCEMNLTALYRSGKGELSQKCRDTCPDACNRLEYSAQVSSIPFINERNEELLRNLTGYGTRSELKENLAEVRFYFENMGLTIITESWDLSLNDLTSNIGGTIALFLGGSLFSLVEIVDLNYLLVQYAFTRKE